MSQIIWSSNGSLSQLKLVQNPDSYTDSLTGTFYDGDDLSTDSLKLEVTISDSSFAINPENIESLQSYCQAPETISEESWMYADPEVVSPKSCFKCNSNIESISSCLLLTLWGTNTGLHLLCRDCLQQLSSDLSLVPRSKILSRKI